MRKEANRANDNWNHVFSAFFLWRIFPYFAEKYKESLLLTCIIPVQVTQYFTVHVSWNFKPQPLLLLHWVWMSPTRMKKNGAFIEQKIASCSMAHSSFIILHVAQIFWFMLARYCSSIRQVEMFFTGLPFINLFTPLQPLERLLELRGGVIFMLSEHALDFSFLFVKGYYIAC